jgi:hypothetical protein
LAIRLPPASRAAGWAAIKGCGSYLTRRATLERRRWQRRRHQAVIE